MWLCTSQRTMYTPGRAGVNSRPWPGPIDSLKSLPMWMLCVSASWLANWTELPQRDRLNPGRELKPALVDQGDLSRGLATRRIISQRRPGAPAGSSVDDRRTDLRRADLRHRHPAGYRDLASLGRRRPGTTTTTTTRPEAERDTGLDASGKSLRGRQFDQGWEAARPSGSAAGPGLVPAIEIQSQQRLL